MIRNVWMVLEWKVIVIFHAAMISLWSCKNPYSPVFVRCLKHKISKIPKENGQIKKWSKIVSVQTNQNTTCVPKWPLKPLAEYCVWWPCGFRTLQAPYPVKWPVFSSSLPPTSHPPAYFALQVISVRRKHKVSPPLTLGPPEFERIFRAQ